MQEAHQILNDFNKYWNDSLNGEYHSYEVNQLAKKVYDLGFDERQIQELSVMERIAYHQATLLYECLILNNRKK